ncbi:DegT/DnrJ/EryC1/StrS family aminotransferase, partial [Rhodoferax sp.]|uniref:DegT/DnrJ/EryC1/StrS family aminotransferase n=1 Tax=Rhodoferax sp. TaxID=50421 RepID=UPI0019E3F4CF
LEQAGKLQRPTLPPDCVHNAHMYYLLLPSLAQRTAFIARLKSKGIAPVFHYIPLHSSLRGQVVGRAAGSMANTDSISDRLVRLPMWLGLEEHLAEVIAAVVAAV